MRKAGVQEFPSLHLKAVLPVKGDGVGLRGERGLLKSPSARLDQQHLQEGPTDSPAPMLLKHGHPADPALGEHARGPDRLSPTILRQDMDRGHIKAVPL